MKRQQVKDPRHQLSVPLGVSLHNTSIKFLEADEWMPLPCAWLEAYFLVWEIFFLKVTIVNAELYNNNDNYDNNSYNNIHFISQG